MKIGSFDVERVFVDIWSSVTQRSLNYFRKMKLTSKIEREETSLFIFCGWCSANYGPSITQDGVGYLVQDI